MRTGSNPNQASPAKRRTHAASVCDEILATRVTALEEIQSELPGPYSRSYFRVLRQKQRPVRFAVLGPSQFSHELELELMRLGFDGVAIRNPADDEVERLGDFHLAPEWVRWVMPCPSSLHGWIESVGNSTVRNQLRRKLRKCDSVRFDVKPLTLGDYRKWYEQLYVPEILSKPGAIPAWQDVEQFAGKNHMTVTEPADSQQVPGFLRIFLFNEGAGLIGGVVVSIDEADRTLRIRAGAFEAHSRSSKELALKSMAVLVEEGRARDFAALSYGDDPNLYGVDVTLGLQRFKASVGMRPIPSRNGTFQLFKPFAEIFRQLGADEQNEAYGGLFCFAVAGEGSARVAAYHRLKALPAAPLSYDEKTDLMLANALGLQLGADPRACSIRVPKGMTVVRVDCPVS